MAAPNDRAAHDCGTPDDAASTANAASSRRSELYDFAVRLFGDAARAVSTWSPLTWLGAAACLAVMAAVVLLVDVPSVASFRAWAEHLGPWFVLAFWAAYVVGTVFPMPRTLWTVAAGVLFGPWTGLAVAVTALTTSATLALVTVRGLLGDWMRPRLTHPAVANLNERLARRGWFSVLSLRMVGAVPFSVLNYAAALTAIPVRQFALATAIGSTPTTIVGIFFGDALTGHGSPWVIAVMVGFAAVGIVGLIVDARTPLATNGDIVKS